MRAAPPSRSPALWLGLVTLTGFGLWVRLRGLGALGLVVDEGNQALAVRAILEQGLPIVPSGFVYGRNLLFLYTQALFAAGLGLDEFALRLPAALFGTAAILATFSLGRGLFDARVGLAAAALVACSLWEISLSRYARPYTAFQCLYVLALLAFHRGFLLRLRPWRLAFAGLALLALATHELAVLLATCFAIPLLLTRRPLGERLRLLAGAPLLAGAWVVYHRSADALLARLAPASGLSPVTPAEAPVAAARLWWGLPQVDWPDLTSLHTLWTGEPLWMGILAGGLLAAALASTRLLWKSAPRRIPLLWLALVAAGMHQFALVLLLLGADLLLFGRRDALVPRPLRPVLAAIALAFVFWTLRLAGHADAAGWKPVALLLAGYPNVLQHFVFWFATAWPLLWIGFVAGCAGLVWRHLGDRRRPTPIFAVACVALPALGASLFRSYFEARYVFHLFPVMAIVFAWGVLRLADGLAARLPAQPAGLRTAVIAGLTVLALFATGDANPAAAWSVGARDHGTTLDPQRGVISWQPYAGFHQDHRSASDFVRSHRRPGDRVVVLGPPHILAVYGYYLEYVDASVGRAQDVEYTRRRDGQVIAQMTGSQILQGADALARALVPSEGSGVFLLGDSVLLDPDTAYYAADILRLVAPLAASPSHVGGDGMTFVVEIRQ